jgi:hypothetical protein
MTRRGGLIRTVCAAGLLGAAAAGATLGWASPAGATIDAPNKIGCAGQAVITKTNGQVVTINATQKTAHIPRTASKRVTYSGSVTTITHNHHGYVAVVLGPFKIHFYSWSGKNASNKSSDSGTRTYPSVLKNVPPGKYRVTGGHFAPEGSCTGSMTLIVDGSPLSNVAGIVALAGSILFAVVLLLSLFGKPVVGVIGGLLLGLFLVVDLMLWRVSYPTTLLLFGLPVAGIVVGLGLGIWGPIGRSATP